MNNITIGRCKQNMEFIREMFQISLIIRHNKKKVFQFRHNVPKLKRLHKSEYFYAQALNNTINNMIYDNST